MNSTRVIVANELRSYREAIAQVFASLRAGVEVFTAEPENLDQEVVRLRPDFVICSQATFMVNLHVPVWVELYPNRAACSIVSVRGETKTVEEIQLTDLLALLDYIQDLAPLI